MKSADDFTNFIEQYGRFRDVDIERVQVTEATLWQQSVGDLLLAKTPTARAKLLKRLAAFDRRQDPGVTIAWAHDDVIRLMLEPLSIPSPAFMTRQGHVTLEARCVLAAIAATIQIDWLSEKVFLRCLDNRCRRIFDATGLDPRQTHCPAGLRGNSCAKRKWNREWAQRKQSNNET
jgi:hypothetical protein